MNEGDEVLYTIVVSGIKNIVMRKSASDTLAHNQVPLSLQNIQDHTINIPRLFTFWRGDDTEAAWQTTLREAIEKIGATIVINVDSWSLAPGYPKNTLEETK